ncbi:MAG: hypothetical protein NZ528_09905 [Caldilineales bacterium]|nr:hypothetical protein [Caldilineales bacterium]MDW8316675.1 hypothetical protein [Anaerolineae bacterium]
MQPPSPSSPPKNFLRFAGYSLLGAAAAIAATLAMATALALLMAAAVVAEMGGADIGDSAEALERILFPVVGALTGLAGGLVSYRLVQRRWPTSLRWRTAWLALWALCGAAIWVGLGLMTQPTTATELALSSLGGWALAGAAPAVAFALLAPPWRQGA